MHRNYANNNAIVESYLQESSVTIAEARDHLIKDCFFAFGPVGPDGDMWRGEVAFRSVLKSPESAELFKRVFAEATLEGKLYALIGLRLVDRKAFDECIVDLADSAEKVQILQACEAHQYPIGPILDQMLLGECSCWLSNWQSPRLIMNPVLADGVYTFEIEVSARDVDRNGHVNNVVYIQWMQDAAIAHARVSGCTAASEAVGATWVVRTHQIEYLAPAFDGDKITLLTWPANFQRVRSLRKYKFVRTKDQMVIARAETDWVFVNAKNGRPQSIPDEVKKTLPVVSQEQEP